MFKEAFEYIKVSIWPIWSKFKLTADPLHDFHIWDYSRVLMAKIDIGTHRYTFLDLFLGVESIYGVQKGIWVHEGVHLADLV